MKIKNGWVVDLEIDAWGEIADIGFSRAKEGYLDKGEALKAFIDDWNEKEARRTEEEE